MKTIRIDQLERYKKMTDENDHTGVRLAIATDFDMTQYIRLFTAIKEIQEVYGAVIPELAKLRKVITDDMAGDLSKMLGYAEYEKIKDII